MVTRSATAPTHDCCKYAFATDLHFGREKRTMLLRCLPLMFLLTLPAIVAAQVPYDPSPRGDREAGKRQVAGCGAGSRSPSVFGHSVCASASGSPSLASAAAVWCPQSGLKRTPDGGGAWSALRPAEVRLERQLRPAWYRGLSLSERVSTGCGQQTSRDGLSSRWFKRRRQCRGGALERARAGAARSSARDALSPARHLRVPAVSRA